MFTDITKTYSLTGLNDYKRFACPLTLDETTILLAVTWLLQIPDLKTCQQTLVNGGKSSSLKQKETVAGTDCLEKSQYNELQFLNKKFI